MTSLGSSEAFRESLRPYLETLLVVLREQPHHVIIESILGLFIIWLLFIRKTVNPKLEAKNKLSKKEQDWLIETWQPEPLVPSVAPPEINVIEKIEDNYLLIRGVKGRVLNLNSFDFLGFGHLPQVKTAAKETLEKYGCGSCGPRGFYGTIDLHLEFEREIAAFMGTEVIRIFLS